MTGDLVERLTAELDERQTQGMAMVEALLDGQPLQVDFDEVHPLLTWWWYAHPPGHGLRTIAVHRKWLDQHQPHAEYTWLCKVDSSFYPCETVVDLAGIYLPEEGS